MVELADTLVKELGLASTIISQGKNFKHILIPEYDRGLLPGIETDGKNLPDDFKLAFFSHLHQFDQTEGNINDYPCIYAFELIDKLDCERVLAAFTQLNQEEIQRKLPALNTYHTKDSNYLYVGKVECAVGNRLVTHLGYYRQQGNHGLQLAYWMKDLVPSVRIRVHIFRFEKAFKPYISSFEVIMAKKLNPIIGRHK